MSTDGSVPQGSCHGDDEDLSESTNELIVVGIGASAGGVEALEKLFREMPNDTGLAFVIVQHLSPDFKSLMPQILSRKTDMPVVSIQDQIELLANHVYVLPNGKDVRIDGNRLLTTDHSESRDEHPINAFFHSLAIQYGPNAVGIVLSGTGSDGSRGIEKSTKTKGW